MQKPIDRIYEAYFDGMGEPFTEKVRKRIHWICREAKGQTILDVGCSQGIVSILLGREGKQVLGIDLIDQAIEFAIEKLQGEEKETQELVKFKKGNFITYDFGGNTFDVVLLTEVLEHLNQPELFIKKAHNILNKEGKIVVTVPFGINDYFDHKKTYYMIDLLLETSPYFIIEKIEFLGKWIGLVGTKKEELSEDCGYEISTDLIKRLELAFYDVERNLVTELNTIKKKYEALNENYRKIELQQKEYYNRVSALEKENLELTQEMMQIKSQSKLLSQNVERDGIISNISSINRVEELMGKLEEQIIKTERIQKENEILKLELSNSNKEKQQIIQSYNALKNSKLGKIIIKYWAFRKKFNN